MAPHTINSLLNDYSLRSLVLNERYYRDTHQWEYWRNVYHHDSTLTRIETSAFSGDIDGFFTFSKEMGSRLTSKHFIQPVHITVKGERALVVSYGHVFLRATIRGVEYDVLSWGWWYHRALEAEVNGEKEWKLISLRFVYDRDSVQTSNPSSTIDADVKVPPNAREAYKYMDWLLTEQGWQVSKDCIGADRPKEAEEFRNAETAWVFLGNKLC